MIQRVKNGSRKIYERARAAENWGRLGGMVPTVAAGWVRAVLGFRHKSLTVERGFEGLQSVEWSIACIVVAEFPDTGGRVMGDGGQAYFADRDFHA